MKKNILIAVCCTILFSISTVAYSIAGPYVSGNLGLAMLRDSDLVDSEVPPEININVKSETGLALGIAAGYGFTKNFRLEGEIAYQKNDLDKASLNIFNLGVDVNLTGDTESLALLLNGYFDFANKSHFTPFLSAGLGIANVEINNFNVQGSGVPSDNDDDTVFAYQVSTGLGYAINEMGVALLHKQ